MILLPLICVLLITGSIQAVTYHVSLSGNDTADADIVVYKQVDRVT